MSSTVSVPVPPPSFQHTPEIPEFTAAAALLRRRPPIREILPDKLTSCKE